MPADIEYRGIIIRIPSSDDGVWRWGLSTGSEKRARYDLPAPLLPRPAYKTRGSAIAGAKKAIDEFLSTKRARGIQKDDAEV